MSCCLGRAGAVRRGKSAHAECGGLSITEFVETLYQKQARLPAANTPIDEAEFNAVFSRSIRRLMRASRRHAGNRPIGPLLNAFSAEAGCRRE